MPSRIIDQSKPLGQSEQRILSALRKTGEAGLALSELGPDPDRPISGLIARGLIRRSSVRRAAPTGGKTEPVFEATNPAPVLGTVTPTGRRTVEQIRNEIFGRPTEQQSLFGDSTKEAN